jgi:hypothetical protein
VDPGDDSAFLPDNFRTIYRASVDDPTPFRQWPAKNFHHRWGYRNKRPVHEALFLLVNVK